MDNPVKFAIYRPALENLGVWNPPPPRSHSVTLQQSEPALRATAGKSKFKQTEDVTSSRSTPKVTEAGNSPVRKKRKTRRDSSPIGNRSTITMDDLPPGPNGEPWKYAPVSPMTYAVYKGRERVSLSFFLL
jgi:hypothetical protein